MILFVVFSPFIFGILSYIFGKERGNVRDLFAIESTFIELAAVLYLVFSPAVSVSIGSGLLAGGLSFQTDGFRKVYAFAAVFMWAFSSLFSRDYFRHERRCLSRYWAFMLVTLGAMEGLLLSADFMTSFVFFEILSFTSFVWVIHEETPGAVRAGYTYLFIAVIGGLVLFMGLALLKNAAGTLVFEELSAAVPKAAAQGKSRALLAACICILLGFGAKAGMFPLHVWLPKAHPIAPSPASALLSGMLTKAGIYGILMTACFAAGGDERFALTVMVLGLITMLLGAVLALFSVNVKRTLACSSMSQIGFILTGIAMMMLLENCRDAEGAELALCGLMLHMVNHSAIKLDLFLCSGVLVMDARSLILDDVRGFGRKRSLLKIAFALGALGISGVPLFNGYISKTLLHESITAGAGSIASLGSLLTAAEWVFLFSGGLTFAYMLKLFICIFVEKNRDASRQKLYDEMAPGTTLAGNASLVISSVLMAVLGQPAIARALAAFMSGSSHIAGFAAFSLENLKGAAISLAIGAAVYLLIVRKVLIKDGSYRNLWPQRLDLEDMVYRPVLTRFLPCVFGDIARVFGEDLVLRPVCRAVLLAFQVVLRFFDTLPDALLLVFRKTLFKERKVKGAAARHPGLIRTVAEELSESSKPVTGNFSFALMMTCIGIVVVLCIIVFTVR